jgi:hypothetical protein
VKYLLVTALLMTPLLAACAHPLEQIVDAKHQARVDAANAHRPLTSGAADGLGTYALQDHEEAEAATLRTQP